MRNSTPNNLLTFKKCCVKIKTHYLPMIISQMKNKIRSIIGSKAQVLLVCRIEKTYGNGAREFFERGFRRMQI